MQQLRFVSPKPSTALRSGCNAATQTGRCCCVSGDLAVTTRAAMQPQLARNKAARREEQRGKGIRFFHSWINTCLDKLRPLRGSSFNLSCVCRRYVKTLLTRNARSTTWKKFENSGCVVLVTFVLNFIKTWRRFGSDERKLGQVFKIGGFKSKRFAANSQAVSSTNVKQI